MEQPLYNLFHRTRVEREYLPLYPELGLTIYSPLAETRPETSKRKECLMNTHGI